jgi:hypothetical protein
MIHLQGDLFLVRRPELVPFPLQEGHGAGLVMEPACLGLHRALPFGVQTVRTQPNGDRVITTRKEMEAQGS